MYVIFRTPSAAHRRAGPNTSVEARPNGKAPQPASRLCVSSLQRLGRLRRRPRLTSNVRPPNKASSALSRENRMHEWLASTKPPKTTNSSGPLSTGAQEAEKPRSRNAVVNMAPIASKAVLARRPSTQPRSLKRPLPHSLEGQQGISQFRSPGPQDRLVGEKSELQDVGSAHNGGLTPRSRRGPTARQPARFQVVRIILPAGGLPRRRSRLTSNVRPPSSTSQRAVARERNAREASLRPSRPKDNDLELQSLSTGNARSREAEFKPIEAEKSTRRDAVEQVPSLAGIAWKFFDQGNAGLCSSHPLNWRPLQELRRQNTQLAHLLQAKVLRLASLAWKTSDHFKSLACSQRWPNPSVEARPNGKAARPLPGCAYHPSSGRATSPSAPPHLER